MRYFIVSDIHSFYTELKQSLMTSGFDKKNPDHTLIVLGDVFDRGNETLEVYKFLKSIPKKRCILIRGNHESLYLELLNKDYPESHDFSNGTVNTFCQIANLQNVDWKYFRDRMIPGRIYWNTSDEIEPQALALWKKVVEAVKNSEVTKWLKSNQWVNFYELDKFVFVHAFIPLTFEKEQGMPEDYCIYYGWTRMFKFRSDWRNAKDYEWEKATWGCPYTFVDAGLFDDEIANNKVLVCGHYRCSEFNEHYLNINTHDIYYGKNLIAIDATTALSHQVNVLVIEGINSENIITCYDQKLNLLIEKKPVPFIETFTKE